MLPPGPDPEEHQEQWASLLQLVFFRTIETPEVIAVFIQLELQKAIKIQIFQRDFGEGAWICLLLDI